MRFIGGTVNPCIGAPVESQILRPELMHPAAIAAAPIQAAPLRNSLLFSIRYYFQIFKKHLQKTYQYNTKKYRKSQFGKLNS
jgi:hypothetical protein